MMRWTNIIILCLLMFLIGGLYGQDDIEQYLLTDSLEIESLVEDPPPGTHEGSDIQVKAFTQVGVTVRQTASMGKLNQSLSDKGYGTIPELNPGWSFATRADIGDHWTFGFSYGGNYFLATYQEGPQNASRYTYFDFLINMAYRNEVAGFQLAPGVGFGISQDMLTMKPNGQKEIDWDDLHQSNELITAAHQIDFAVSFDLSIGKYLTVKEHAPRLLDVKLGYMLHPFSFGDPGIPIAEINAVKIKGMPEMKSSGPYITITWGFGPRN